MAVRQELSFQSADEVTTIHGYCWRPEEGKPKAVVHICHGMVEFIERYDALANYLCEHGYVVYGADTLGHGKSVVNKKCFGYFGDKMVIGSCYPIWSYYKDWQSGIIPDFHITFWDIALVL